MHVVLERYTLSRKLRQKMTGKIHIQKTIFTTSKIQGIKCKKFASKKHPECKYVNNETQLVSQSDFGM